MARSLPVGLAELLRSGWAESHSTLELTVSPISEPARTYYLATSPITVQGVAHEPYLRETGGVRYSLTAAADRTEATIENASTIFGEDFIGHPDALHGATARLGRYWRDLQSGAEFHVYLCTAVVTGGTANNDAVSLTLTSDLYAKTSTGGGRIVSRLCQWKFRGTECGYSGVELACNKRHTDADGCSGRSNTHKYGGFIYLQSANVTSGAAGAPLPPANQSVTDGSTQYAMQPYIEFTGATITNVSGSSKTKVEFSAAATGTEAVINVKDSPYSATGDGTTDDTSAIASAITAAISSGKPLYFPPGTYKANITGLDNGMKLFGAGPTKSIIKAPNSTSAVIEVTGASMHTLEISDLGIQGFGSGSANHGLYVHDNTFEAYLIRCDRVKVWDCGGKGIYFDGHFTTHMSHVEITNCGDNAFDFSGNNTNYFSHCYVDDLAANKVAYRIRAGQVVLINCNGIDSLGTGTSWGVFGDLLADDGRDAYCDATLIGCNVESAYTGVYAKSGSRVSLYNTFFTTGTSGAHVAVKCAFTNNQPGIIDATCRFNTQGTATWSNSQPIHGTDAPLIQVGRQHATQYYDTSGAMSRDLPAVAVTSLSSTPNCYTPRYAIDRLTVQTSLAMTGGAQATQAGTVAGALGWTVTNSSTNSAAYAGIDLANNAGATGFIRLYASATGIFQVGSDNYDVYFKSNGNNRWYVGNTVFGPLQDNTSDLAASGARIKDAYLAGSLNFAERTAPGTPSANSIVLYAKDKSGASALYMKNDAGTETEIGGSSTPSLTSTRIAFGSGSNLLTESATFTYNDSTKKVIVGDNAAGTGIVNIQGLGSGSGVTIRSASAPGTQGGLVMPFEGGEISYGPGIWWASSASYGTTSGMFLNSGLNWQAASSAHSAIKLRTSTGTSTLGTVRITLQPDDCAISLAAVSLGTTSTDGVVLANSTAAAAGAQQYSPRLRFTGQGWKTDATAASQQVDWIVENRPVQSTANPNGALTFRSAVNGGSYGDILKVFGTGSNLSGTAIPKLTSGLTTGYGYFVGDGPGTNIAVFQGLELSGVSYTFFAVNKYYTGTAWADMGNSRAGCSFQMFDDRFTFYSFDTGTTYTARLSVFPGGTTIVGPNSKLATSATSGFLQIPAMDGIPSGTPDGYVSTKGSMVFDATNNRIYVYNGSAWKYTTLT